MRAEPGQARGLRERRRRLREGVQPQDVEHVIRAGANLTSPKEFESLVAPFRR